MTTTVRPEWDADWLEFCTLGGLHYTEEAQVMRQKIDRLLSDAERAERQRIAGIIEKMLPDQYDVSPSSEELAANHMLREVLKALTNPDLTHSRDNV